MTVGNGSGDSNLTSIENALRLYRKGHQGARVRCYRYNSIAIRIRVIDPSFAGMEHLDRHARIWEYLEKLPEEVQGDISMIVLLAPGEGKRSIANLEFEDPSPSLL